MTDQQPTAPEPADESQPGKLPFPTRLPIGSEWVAAPSTAPVHFPYDGSVVAEAPVGDVDLARQALENALSVRSEVGRLPSHVRRSALQGALSALRHQRDDFVRRVGRLTEELGS